MPKPFDATLKGLLEVSPADWPALAGYPQTKVEVIDADISTVSGAADKVLRVHGPPDWIMHIEFQTGPDASLPRRVHGYNALLEDRHDLPVRTVIVLLRPQAELSNLAGAYERGFAGETPYLTFRYQVIRVWQLSVEQLLSGGLGILPLAPMGAVNQIELPGVIERMKERLRGQSPSQVSNLWTATSILMGLRYQEALVDRVLQGVMAMEESVTYQAILRKGALQELRKTLLLLGHEVFGPPPAEAEATIQGIDDLEKLERLAVRAVHVDSWQELLELPRPRTRRRKNNP